MSKVVVHGDTVYLAGLTADKTVGQSLAEQTREILALIDGFLAKAGTDKSKLLTATIWLSDIRTVDEMNKVWDAWVTPGHTPARACIEALLQHGRLRGNQLRHAHGSTTSMPVPAKSRTLRVTRMSRCASAVAAINVSKGERVAGTINAAQHSATCKSMGKMRSTKVAIT
jgi:enamine deaminase RidA (YjgF/YER057c/UK114 family)